jgi:hypothetical protein
LFVENFYSILAEIFTHIISTKEVESMSQKYDSMEELDASLLNKFDVAKERGIPLTEGYNGNLTAREAGKIGGPIGGAKVRKMVEMAEEALTQNQVDHSN